MKRWIDISKIWVTQAIKMFLMGLILPFIWIFFLMREGDNQYLTVTYIAIMALYGWIHTYSEMKGLLSTVLSLGGSRRDAFLGSTIADGVLLVLAEIGCMLVNYMDKDTLGSRICVSFFGVMMIVEGAGHILYIIEQYFGKIIYIIIAFIIGVGAQSMAFFLISTHRFGNSAFEIGSNRMILCVVGIGMLTILIGKLLQHRAIQKYEITM